jgi:hypothetical protein
MALGKRRFAWGLFGFHQQIFHLRKTNFLRKYSMSKHRQSSAVVVSRRAAPRCFRDGARGGISIEENPYGCRLEVDREDVGITPCRTAVQVSIKNHGLPPDLLREEKGSMTHCMDALPAVAEGWSSFGCASALGCTADFATCPPIRQGCRCTSRVGFVSDQVEERIESPIVSRSITRNAVRSKELSAAEGRTKDQAHSAWRWQSGCRTKPHVPPPESVAKNR